MGITEPHRNVDCAECFNNKPSHNNNNYLQLKQER